MVTNRGDPSEMPSAEGHVEHKVTVAAICISLDMQIPFVCLLFRRWTSVVLSVFEFFTCSFSGSKLGQTRENNEQLKTLTVQFTYAEPCAKLPGRQRRRERLRREASDWFRLIFFLYSFYCQKNKKMCYLPLHRINLNG